MRSFFFPGLLPTGFVCVDVRTICDGFVNLFVLSLPTGLVCIDSGWNPRRLRRSFKMLGLRPEEVCAVLLTHMHWDHARGSKAFPNAQLFCGGGELIGITPNRFDHTQPVTSVADGQVLSVAGARVEVITTPGHTRGAVSYLVNDCLLFTGDALRLKNGCVRPFHFIFNQDNRIMVESLDKLARVAPRAQALFTGHTGYTADVVKAFAAWTDGRETKASA